ncbi:MAG: right-handed parallel beta-helix repeat-containing protein, partial [Thermoplasmata archaeon]
MRYRGFWLFLALALLLALGVLATEVAAIPEDPPMVGDWMIDGQKEFEDKTGFVEGSVIVSPGATFKLKNAVLTVNHSFVVNDNANLEVVNSTIRFNCSYDYANRFEVLGFASCVIQDQDGDRTTDDDKSVVTSVNDVPYNFSVAENATQFILRNSLVSKAGRPHNDPFLDEGFVIRANDARIEGSVITDGYYGLILDQCERVTVANTTIEDCYIGLYMVGTRECNLAHTTIKNNTIYGAQVRGFHGNLIMDSMTMSGNGQANMYMLYVSGFNNEIINGTYGPIGTHGIYMEEVQDTSFLQNTVTGCTIGIEVRGGDTGVTDQTVTDCPQGVLVKDAAVIRFMDLDLRDTTISVARATNTNITAIMSMVWERVTANLTCDLAVQVATTIEVESSVLNFEDSRDGPTGLYNLRGGTLIIRNSTVDSPTGHSLVVQLLDGSRSTLFQSTFMHMGTSTGDATRLGMHVAGTGTLELVTLSDSLAGLVFGNAQINMINLTIQNCLTGILADGDMGRGGASIRGLDLSGCDVAIRSINDGSVSVVNGRFDLIGEGFNITTAGVEIKDSWVSDPGMGMSTARLRQTATLDIINSVTSRDFDIGPVENSVNIYWYLNLTMLYLSDGSPLSEALVSAREVTGAISIRDEQAGVDGKVQELLMRERAYNPDMTITTPHTITVTKGGLSDSFDLT